MTKQFYLPRTDEGKAIWLHNFAAKLVLYAMKYGITPEEIMDMQQAAMHFAEILNFSNQQEAFKTAITAYKNSIRDGVKNGVTLQPLTMPTMNLMMTVQPGIFVRAKAIVNRIKANILYSEADGNDLGIEGAEITADTADVRPAIKVRIGDGGHPEIVWTKQGFDAIEIYKQEADGAWRLLAIDIQPNYLDEEALPPHGKSAVWTYRAIYRKKDKRVGQWSDVVSVTVMG